MTQPSKHQDPDIAIPREEVFHGGPVNSRFFENERSPLEGTKGLGTMTTCDKRGSSGTRRDSTRQNSKRESLNIGRASAPAQPTPTCGAWCTNWPREKCKVKLHGQPLKPRTGHTTDIAQWNTLWNISSPISESSDSAHHTHQTRDRRTT